MNSVSILLVCDESLSPQTLASFLHRHLLFEIVGNVITGEEALELAPTLRPDVILCDLFMPGLSGVETVKWLRAELPYVRIIALSLYYNVYFERAAREAGADGFVSKADLGEGMLAEILRWFPDAQLPS